MVTVQIDDSRASLDEAVIGGWITEQLKRRETEGNVPCVTVSIAVSSVHLTLATPTCPSSGRSGGRRANQQEQEILDLWDRHRMNQTNFSPGDLQAFLRKLSQSL